MFWAPKEGPTKCYLLNKPLKDIDLRRSLLSDLNPNYDWSKNLMPNFFQCFRSTNWTFQLFKDLVYFSSKPKDIQCQNYYKLKLIHIECFVDIWLLIGSSFKRIRLEKYRWLIFLKQRFVCSDWVLLQFQEVFRFSPQLHADAFILSLAINPKRSDPTIWNTRIIMK